MPFPTMCGWPAVSVAFRSPTLEVRFRFVPFPRASLGYAVAVMCRIDVWTMSSGTTLAEFPV